MSRPTPPEPAKLVTGLFTPDKSLFEPVAAALEGAFGPADYISKWLAFDFTEYYTPEMGTPLFRRFISFKQLIEQDRLPTIKHFTNGLEAEYKRGGQRRVNIDPGYLLASRFVLATGKNFAHRIYIGRNIYADLTLTYRNGAFQTLPWTYPDYADRSILIFLEKVRNKYILDKNRI